MTSTEYVEEFAATRNALESLSQRMERLERAPAGMSLTELQVALHLLRDGSSRSSRESEEVREQWESMTKASIVRLPYQAVAMWENLSTMRNSAVAKEASGVLDQMGLLRVADFGGRVVKLLFHEQQQCIWTGLFAGLPGEHPFRRRIATEDELYEGHDGEPSVVLCGGETLLGWYPVDDVLRATKSWRRPQLQAAENAKRDEERQREEREQRWRESAAGRDAARDAEIAALKEQVRKLAERKEPDHDSN